MSRLGRRWKLRSLIGGGAGGIDWERFCEGFGIWDLGRMGDLWEGWGGGRRGLMVGMGVSVYRIGASSRSRLD